MQAFLFVSKWICSTNWSSHFTERKTWMNVKLVNSRILEKSFDFWEFSKSTPFDQSYKHPVFAILSGGVFFSACFGLVYCNLSSVRCGLLIIVNCIKFYAPIVWNKLKIHQFEFLSWPFSPSCCWNGSFFAILSHFWFCSVQQFVGKNVDIEIQQWQKLNHTNKSIRRTLDLAIQYTHKFWWFKRKNKIEPFGWQQKTNQMQTIFQM